jgi:predicted DNA-binding transcriptional regulator AlpA
MLALDIAHKRENKMKENLIHIGKVIMLTGLNPGDIYALELSGDFPKRVEGIKIPTWEKQSVVDWKEKREK